MLKTKKEIGYVIGIVLAVLAIIAVIAVGIHLRRHPSVPEVLESPAPTAEDHGWIQEVETVSYETIQDGLRSMGFLVTEEYYFTEVITDSKTLKLLFTLPFTESSYVASYEGSVLAGIDFTSAEVETEPVGGKTNIKITLPRATIQTVTIDPKSFVLHSEKDGIGTSFSVEDFNDALKGLQDKVKDKALEKGILDHAETKAEQVLASFVRSLLPETDYDLEIVFS